MSDGIFDDEAILEANNCWHRVFQHAPCTPLEAMKWALREAEKSMIARGKMILDDDDFGHYYATVKLTGEQFVKLTAPPPQRMEG